MLPVQGRFPAFALTVSCNLPRITPGSQLVVDRGHGAEPFSALLTGLLHGSATCSSVESLTNFSIDIVLGDEGVSFEAYIL